VAIFSLEVGKLSLFQKAAYQLAQVDSEKAKQGIALGYEEMQALRRATNELHEMLLYFDTTSTTVTAIHSAVRRRRVKGRVDHVIVDYLQLLGNSGRHDNRAQAVGANAWALKMLATDFQIPVLLLSQFSRPGKEGKPRRPELSDLKESGDIENHANGVWFLHRDAQEDSDQVSVDFMLPKQRDGRRNIASPMWFFPRFQRFEEQER
jgi:replicative DNA helicase